ncbi:MAG: hypothetical protein AMXMBFR13_49230 [Phycisphaerae bacterium]
MLTATLATALTMGSLAASPARDYTIAPVPFTDVKVQDEFWLPRLQTNRKVTVRYCFQQCEDTHRIDNFAVAGKLKPGKFEGTYFNDSDVFKVIEGAAYSLSLHPDPELDKYLDNLIAKIAAAQEPDGYLYCVRTIDPKNVPGPSGKERWSNLRESHELYNVGHMYEAAVAHYQATGKRSLLDVAIKNANLIDAVFGPDKKHDVPGHEEIEIGLVKLYRVTGDERYLKLSKFFVDERGHDCGRKLYGPYCQDHAPVVQQDKSVGHAVRAGYLYSGVADIAAITGDKAYLNALNKIWDYMTGTNQYITGGVGGRSHGEAFGDDFELPNLKAYSETCAAIANALWNHRMFLLHGESKYIDVLERVLYNGFLSGVSMSGDKFFYVNPLASEGNHERQPWFGCACCPVNVVRIIPSLPGYVYAVKEDDIYVNLFVQGTAAIKTKNNTVRISQETRYPWDAKVRFRVEPEKTGKFAIYLRQPGWAGRPWPIGHGYQLGHELYRYISPHGITCNVSINGELANPTLARNGYYRVIRDWKAGDIIEYSMGDIVSSASPEMFAAIVQAHDKVQDCRGRLAVVRGPIVYCAEGIDNGGRALDLVLPSDARLQAEHRPDLLGGVTVIKAKGQRGVKGADGQLTLEPADITLIPYYAWAHRGKGEMAVWLPRDLETLKAQPEPEKKESK